ncbi:MAG TPA: hypothetical protein VHX88_05470 [Solirubrobacteraceae bacterium]|jgi:alkanesulfonate monooxygenase SsuD/methylene tetrahydromethanopterin reductase-like flavin-dependent oxidoreductase (luciferase family)|nr:hypothetical protein [Solirubrobacteraceae bacterium]
MAARKGLGVLGFSLEELAATERTVKAYKLAIQQAEPVGSFVNDNLLVANGINFVNEDRDVARRQMRESGVGYHFSQVYRYHDTFPRPEGFPVWPDVMPDPDDATIDQFIDLGAAIVGDPDDVLAQIKRWEATGADQFVLLRGTKTKQECLDMLRLIGEHVIPKIDTGPVHRTTRLREAASSPVAA